jgi:hypothetical protein
MATFLPANIIYIYVYIHTYISKCSKNAIQPTFPKLLSPITFAICHSCWKLGESSQVPGVLVSSPRFPHLRLTLGQLAQQAQASLRPFRPPHRVGRQHLPLHPPSPTRDPASSQLFGDHIPFTLHRIVSNADIINKNWVSYGLGIATKQVFFPPNKNLGEIGQLLKNQIQTTIQT